MSLFSKYSYISRSRKLELFKEIFHPTEQMHILDVGAEINPGGNGSLQLIDNYPWKKMITAVNISREHIEKVKHFYPEIDSIVGDACHLPWPDKSFDVVYSNAVIEHVGDFEKQKQMASEIMRVGKRWFVTTPNRWYPFEFHMRLPLVTWLPGNGYVLAGRVVRYDHINKSYMFWSKCANPRLMNAHELARCFPGSKIIKHKVTFMAETLISVG